MSHTLGRKYRLRIAAVLLALVGAGIVAYSQDALASRSERTFTMPRAGGGAGAPVLYSPAAACLDADPSRWLGFEFENALFHANRIGSQAEVRVVADLDLVFWVMDVSTRERLYEGRGNVSVNEFVWMNVAPDQGVVSRTLPVDMVAGDGSVVRLLWTVEIWVFLGETYTNTTFGWGPGLVSCA